jgi:hypothetical protein
MYFYNAKVKVTNVTKLHLIYATLITVSICGAYFLMVVSTPAFKVI